MARTQAGESLKNETLRYQLPAFKFIPAGHKLFTPAATKAPERKSYSPGRWKEGNWVYTVAAPGCQNGNSGQRSQRLILVGHRGVVSQAPNFNPNPMRGRDFTARVKGVIEPYEEICG
jgi:hypothetical protein